MYKNDEELKANVKELTWEVDYSGKYNRIIGANPEYFTYYDPDRLYKKGGVFHMNKPAESGFGKEKVKFMLLQDLPDTTITIDNLNYFFTNSTRQRGFRVVSGRVYTKRIA